MNRQERLDLIQKLKEDQMQTLADMEMRREQRELTEDYVVKQSPVNRRLDEAASIEDQLWQQHQQPKPAEREDQLVTIGFLHQYTDCMIDNVVAFVDGRLKEDATKLSKEIDPLLERIALLEKEISLVRQLANGTIKTIRGRNVA